MVETVERQAFVRVDAEPSGKHFQGVWLDFGTDKRWVIAYRKLAHWASFADVEVVVTGHCYTPFGQAISATHFHVDTMRPVDVREARRFLAIHPERLVRGSVAPVEAEADSKLAGFSLQRFREENGTSWIVAGSEERLTPHREMTAAIRVVDVSPSWAAGPTGPHCFVGATYAADYVPDPRYARRPCSCP